MSDASFPTNRQNCILASCVSPALLRTVMLFFFHLTEEKRIGSRLWEHCVPENDLALQILLSLYNIVAAALYQLLQLFKFLTAQVVFFKQLQFPDRGLSRKITVMRKIFSIQCCVKAHLAMMQQYFVEVHSYFMILDFSAHT